MKKENLDKVCSDSFFGRYFGQMAKKYRKFESLIENMYLGSIIGAIISKIGIMLKTCFQHCFAVRFVNKMEERQIFALDSSRFFKRLLSFWEKNCERFKSCENQSQFMAFCGNLKQGFLNMPLKLGEFFLLCFIAFNTLFIFLMGKDISLFGGIMRFIMLFLGFIGLFSNASWEELQSGSFFLRISSNEKVNGK